MTTSHAGEAAVEVVQLTADDLQQAVKNVLHDELGHMIADLEFRLGRFDELARRNNVTAEVVPEPAVVDQVGDEVIPTQIPDGSIYVEDIVSKRHAITGYTVTANSPSAGQITWASLHVVYNGVDYTITGASSALKYHYFKVATPTVLVSTDTKPTAATLGAGGALIFVNNGGTPVSVLEESVTSVLADGAVDSGAIIAGAVGATQLANGAVGTTQLANNAVTSTILADGAVSTSAKIGAGIIAASNIGAGAVTPVKLNMLQHVLY